jgi:23S rRNA (adenine2503-C2)-methyltransferase
MPSAERMDAFQRRLRDSGYSVFVRKQRGDDIGAACGQLALRDAEPKVRRLPLVTAQGRTDA